MADTLVLHADFVFERAFRAVDEQVFVCDAEAKAAIAKPLGLFSEDEGAG